jgi:hypothetical protein
MEVFFGRQLSNSGVNTSRSFLHTVKASNYQIGFAGFEPRRSRKANPAASINYTITIQEFFRRIATAQQTRSETYGAGIVTM